MKKVLASILLATSALVCAQDGPFPYPASLLEAPATLTEPAAAYVRLGKPVVALDITTLEQVSKFTGATRLRDGQGLFARDYLCLESQEAGRRYLTWLISSDRVHVTEVQVEEISKEKVTPSYCHKLIKEYQPVRLGKIGLAMSKQEIKKIVGKESFTGRDGWDYWFSQRYLRNKKNLQELELNWLAIQYDEKKHPVKAFISIVKNP